MFENLNSVLMNMGMGGRQRSSLLELASGAVTGWGDFSYNSYNASPQAIQYQTAVHNAQVNYQKQMADWSAEVSNINAANREAQNQYKYKTAQLAADLDYSQQTLDSIPGQYAQKRSYMEQLLENSQQEYDLESRLLNKKYLKEEGDAVAKWNASGFGSIGMSESLARDVNSRKAIEADVLKTQNDANIIKQQFQLSDLATEEQSVTLEAQKKVSDVQLAQKYNIAPTARKYGAAPVMQTVANTGNYGA